MKEESTLMTSASLVGSSIEQQVKRSSSSSLLDNYPFYLEFVDDDECDSPMLYYCTPALHTARFQLLWNQDRKFLKRLRTLLSDEKDIILFQKLRGITSQKLLLSLVFIVSKDSDSPSSLSDDPVAYQENLKRVAKYFANGRSSRERKLWVLCTMLECLSPPTACWQFQESVVDGTFEFLTNSNQEWEFMDHTHNDLLQTLRAFSLHFKKKEQERVAMVEHTGNTASLYISAGAKLVEVGCKNSLPFIEVQLEKTANKLKSLLKSREYPVLVDRDAVVCMAFSDAAKRASENAKISSKLAVSTIQDVSTRGIDLMHQKLRPFTRENEHKLPPEGVEAIRAMGKVGMASIGAAAVVGEAIIETSRALVEKTGALTADVVEHKYGTSAGQVVSDASETWSNLIRTTGNVALLAKKITPNFVAKNAGKLRVEKEVQQAQESLHLLEVQAAGMIHQALSEGRLEFATYKKILSGKEQEGAAKPTSTAIAGSYDIAEQLQTRSR